MSAHPKTPELSMSAMRSLAATPGSQYVPVALGELYGPMCCSGCGHESWTIWVTPEEKAEKTFIEIYQYEGEARCEKCGPPDATNAQSLAQMPAPKDPDS